jgi:hypothetical protein
VRCIVNLLAHVFEYRLLHWMLTSLFLEFDHDLSILRGLFQSYRPTLESFQQSSEFRHFLN